LIEYENQLSNQGDNQGDNNSQQDGYQQPAPQYADQSHMVYYNNMQAPSNYNTNEMSQQDYNQYVMKVQNEYQKNIVLKSSNDFQDRQHYLKSSTNGEANHQNRPWDNYFQSNNVMEYTNDGFFVENNFL